MSAAALIVAVFFIVTDAVVVKLRRKGFCRCEPSQGLRHHQRS